MTLYRSVPKFDRVVAEIAGRGGNAQWMVYAIIGSYKHAVDYCGTAVKSREYSKVAEQKAHDLVAKIKSGERVLAIQMDCGLFRAVKPEEV